MTIIILTIIHRQNIIMLFVIIHVKLEQCYASNEFVSKRAEDHLSSLDNYRSRMVNNTYKIIPGKYVSKLVEIEKLMKTIAKT